MNSWQYMVVILIFAWLASFFLPWWSIVIICFICGMLWRGSLPAAFWGAFLPLFLMILVQLLFISFPDQFRSASTIGSMLGDLPAWSMLLITPLLYAFVAGLSGLSGTMLSRRIFPRL